MFVVDEIQQQITARHSDHESIQSEASGASRGIRVYKYTAYRFADLIDMPLRMQACGKLHNKTAAN